MSLQSRCHWRRVQSKQQNWFALCWCAIVPYRLWLLFFGRPTVKEWSWMSNNRRAYHIPNVWNPCVCPLHTMGFKTTVTKWILSSSILPWWCHCSTLKAAIEGPIQPLSCRKERGFAFEGGWPTSFTSHLLRSMIFLNTVSVMFLSYKTLYKNQNVTSVVAVLQAGPNLDHVKFILPCLLVNNRGLIWSDTPFILYFGSVS